MNIAGSDTTSRTSTTVTALGSFAWKDRTHRWNSRLGTASIAKGLEAVGDRGQQPENPDVATGCELQKPFDAPGIARIDEEPAGVEAFLDVRWQLALISGVQTRDVRAVVDGPVPPEQPVDVMEWVGISAQGGQQVRPDLQSRAERREQASHECGGRRFRASADHAQFQAFPGRQDGRPVAGVVIGTPQEHGLLGVDDDRGGMRPGLDGAAECEVGHHGRAPSGRQVHGPQSRLRLDQGGDDSVLGQAVAQAEQVGTRCFGPGRLDTESPAQADRIREIEPVSGEQALDRDDEADHPDQSPRDRTPPTLSLWRGPYFRGMIAIDARAVIA